MNWTNKNVKITFHQWFVNYISTNRLLVLTFIISIVSCSLLCHCAVRWEPYTIDGRYIISYWAQISFALAFGIYFIKETRSFFYKKKEINHSLYQQKKIEAIDQYIRDYSDCKKAFRELYIYGIFCGEVPAKEVDIALEPLNRLESSSRFLILYLDDELYSRFEKITNGVLSLSTKLSILKSNSTCKDNPIELDVMFTKFRCEVNKETDSDLRTTLKKIRDLWGAGQ